MKSDYIYGFLIALMVLVVIGFGLIKPYFEAKSFNECTGGHASYMTALTTELRVQECKR